MATYYGTYTSGSTTWTAPFTVTSVVGKATGGGGGGGGVTGTKAGGGGGAGGAYAIGTLNVTAGIGTYPVVVGAGGGGGTTNGTAGAASWFANTGSLSAPGGAAGTGGATNLGTYGGAAGGTTGGAGAVLYAGGAGATSVGGTAAGARSGGGGGGASDSGPGGTTTTASGGTAAGSFGGGGGAGGGTAGAAGAVGTAAGGGGGGGFSNNTTDRNGGNAANGKIILEWTPTALSYNQNHFQFYKDDTNLNGAGTFADIDANITGTVNSVYRFRAEVANIGGEPGTLARLLQWQGGGTVWTNVGTATTAPIYLTPSAYFADGDATTTRLTAVGTFVAGKGYEGTCLTASGTISPNYYMEDEWNLKFGTSTVAGSTYELRSTNNGTAFNTYGKTGSITALAQSSPTVTYNTPADTTTVYTTTPVMNFTGTDVNYDKIEYNVQVDTVNTFNSQSGGSLLNNINFYTKFDTNGNDSVNSLVGTVVGATNTPGKIGNGYTFDGIGDYIAFADNNALDLVSPYSFSFWFKSTDNSQTNNYLFGKLNEAGNDNCYAVVFGYHASKISFYGGPASSVGYPTNGDITISDNNWHHIAYTYNGTTLKGYLDNSSAFADVTGTTSNLTSSKNFFIGDFDGSGGFSPIGILDEIGIWSKVLSATEVESLYNSGVGLQYPFSHPLLSKFSATPDAGFDAGHPFTAGQAVNYTVQGGDALTLGSTYYWRVAGIDPTGSNAYGAWGGTWSFTIGATSAYAGFKTLLGVGL